MPRWKRRRNLAEKSTCHPHCIPAGHGGACEHGLRGPTPGKRQPWPRTTPDWRSSLRGAGTLGSARRLCPCRRDGRLPPAPDSVRTGPGGTSRLTLLPWNSTQAVGGPGFPESFRQNGKQRKRAGPRPELPLSSFPVMEGNLSQKPPSPSPLHFLLSMSHSLLWAASC